MKWFLLLFVAINACRGADYYAATNGNDTTGDGSIGSPYRSLDKALSKAGLAAGDTIHLGVGSFTGAANTDVAGASGSPITVVGADRTNTFWDSTLTADQPFYTFSNFTCRGWTPIEMTSVALGTRIEAITFSLNGTPIDNGSSYFMVVSNCTFIRWRLNGAIRMSGFSNTVASCAFIDGLEGTDVIRANGAWHCRIHSCIMSNLPTPNENIGTSVDTHTIGTGTKLFTTQAALAYAAGDYMQAVNSAGLESMTGFVNSYDNGTGAFSLEVANISGSGTFSSWNIRWINEGNHTDILQGFTYATTNIVFEQNLIVNNSGQFGNLTADDTFGTGDTNFGGWIIRNNVFTGSRTTLNLYVPDNLIYNNTFYNWTGSQVGIKLDDGHGGSGWPSWVWNNIFCRIGGTESTGIYNVNMDDLGYSDYNLITDIDDSAKTSFTEANGINGGYTPSQIFVDAPGGDFRLVAGSPAIGAATNLSALMTTDYAGNTRSSWDIGAYAFVAAAMVGVVNVSGTLNVGSIYVPRTPLLQEVTNAAAGAYSVARSLTNSWTSALALVVRSSDSATNYLVPQWNTNNIDAIVTWAGSDSVYVTNLYDQTGNGRTLTGTNLSMLPRIVTNGVHISKNGKTSMRFDVTSDSVMDSLTADVTLSLPVTEMLVVNVVSGSAPIVCGASDGITNCTILTSSIVPTYRLANGTNVNAGVQTDDDWDILRVVFDGVSSIGVDGGATVTANAGLNTLTVFSLGSPNEIDYGTSDMILSEWVLFNAALSETDQQALRNNMNAFYSVY